jgi:L-amino acid N-acyltransferase YncA
MIRAAAAGDAGQICEIYNHYVLWTHITFEEQPVQAGTMAQRMKGSPPMPPWLVWVEGQEILGFAYAGKWKERSAYRHCVESTIYLRSDATSKGIGSRLYAALLTGLRAQQLHAVIGIIALPNAASVALHERLGFAKAGHFREVGWKFDRWIDVGYWQALL